MSVLNSDSTTQTRTDKDELFGAAAGDVAEAVSGVERHNESFETVNEIIVDSKRPSPNCVCACKVHITDLKNVKSDVAVLHKQIESINRVIKSTNSIIKSISAILNPAGAENRGISYDLRLETLFNEFSLVLNEKNRQLEERDNIIAELQDKLSKIGDQCQNLPNEFIHDECPKQKPCHDHRNHEEVICDSSEDIVSNTKTVDLNISAHSQQNTVDKNLRVGNNKVNRPNNTRLDNDPPQQKVKQKKRQNKGQKFTSKHPEASKHQSRG